MFVDESQRELCICIAHVLWRDELNILMALRMISSEQ